MTIHLPTMFRYRSSKHIGPISLLKVVKQLSQSSQAKPEPKVQEQTTESTDLTGSFRYVTTRSILDEYAEPRYKKPVSASKGEKVINAVLDVQQQQNDLLKISLPFDKMPGPPILKMLDWVKQLAPSSMASPLHYLGSMLAANLTYNRTTRAFEHMFKKYGPVVHLGAVDIVFLSRPEHFQTVFCLEEQHPVRFVFGSLEQYRMHRKLFGPGPFCSSGREWQDMRMRLAAPLRRSTERYCAQLDAVAQELALRVRSTRTKQYEVSESFYRELFRWSLESIGLVCLDKRMGCLASPKTAEGEALVSAMTGTSEAVRRCESGFQTWRFMGNSTWNHLVSSCDDINRIMSSHVRAAQDGSLVKVLLHGTDASPESALSALLDLLLVGTNTTAHAAAFLLYHLAQNPNTQHRLYQEVRSVLPKKDFPLTLFNISRMPYMRACLKESLRLRPPIPVLTRVLPRDMSLHGYHVRKDSTVLMMSNVTAQREENFVDAAKFWPERWIKSHRRHHPFANLPFGDGERACPARDVAELQLSLITARLVRNFKVEYHYGVIEATSTLMGIPEKPLKFRFVDRPD